MLSFIDPASQQNQQPSNNVLLSGLDPLPCLLSLTVSLHCTYIASAVHNSPFVIFAMTDEALAEALATERDTELA